MANFCQKCGFPQSAASAFCSQCGAQNAGAVTSPVAQQAPRPSSGGSALKIVLVVLVCLFMAGAAAIGGLYYVGHKVKQAVLQKAAENGVDLSGITSPVSSANAPKTKLRKNVCEYLSKEEASRLIGEPVESAEPRDLSCLYTGPAGLAAKLAQQQGDAEFKKAEAPGAKPDAIAITNAVDQIASTAAAESGMMGANGEWPLLIVGVDPDGKPQMTALAAANGIFGGLFRAAEGQNAAPGDKRCTPTCFGANVPGLGDRALRLPKLGLNVLQGEILVRVIPGPLPGADQKTIDVARVVLRRL